jgi:hypothetical protein
VAARPAASDTRAARERLANHGPILLVELELRLQRLRSLVHPFPGVTLHRQSGTIAIVSSSGRTVPISSEAKGADVVEVDPRLRLEVEAQFIDELWAVVKVRPEVKAEAGKVHRPDDVCHVGENEGARGRPVRRADDRRLQPLRPRFGDALLEERAALRAVRVPNGSSHSWAPIASTGSRRSAWRAGSSLAARPSSRAPMMTPPMTCQGR